MEDQDSEALWEQPLRVASLHALAYCERLFYLEEVEELRVADAAVFAGRALHEEIAKDEGDVERLFLQSDRWGLRGMMDALRRRDGRWIVYEHKRGRAARSKEKKPEPWGTDRLQVLAYAVLLEEAKGETILEGRIRYHADNITLRVPFDDAAREEVRVAIDRARALRRGLERPPVTKEPRRCVRCSLATVCLPEEERLAKASDWEPIDLSVKDDERKALHLVSIGTRLGRSSEELVVMPLEGPEQRFPVREYGHVVLHGAAQASTQALHLCVEKEVSVSWITGGGRFIGTLAASGPTVHRRIRQYRALTDDAQKFALAKAVVQAKVEAQLKFLLRSTRGAEERSTKVSEAVNALRVALKEISEAESVASLLGYEGNAALQYFSSWEEMLSKELDERLRYAGRTRRPPKDRVSALLGFGYALLLADVTSAIVGVGLEPSLGFYHQPRSSAPPLALDLMELFRVPLVDMPVVASLNRGQWHVTEDFLVNDARVWLSESGKKKLIALYEKRKEEEWKHTAVGYSLSYARMIELEARLLEKEWSGAPGLFAKFRLR